MRLSTSDRMTVIATCWKLLSIGADTIDCLSLTPVSTSYRVRLSDCRSVIVKFYFGAASSKAVKERHIIEALSRIGGVHTARLLGYGQLQLPDALALITSDLGDHTLWRAVENHDCSYHEGLRLIGQLLTTFHDSTTSTWPALKCSSGLRQLWRAAYDDSSMCCGAIRPMDSPHALSQRCSGW